MLTHDEIQNLIVCRTLKALDSCNSHHINHVEGQVRALIAVLNDGVAPPCRGDVAEYWQAADIPLYTNPDGSFELDEAWLLSRGFLVDGDRVTHPKYQGW